jgi:cytochrome c biogenesis protein CcdA/thiol-disulfide isomerase/thioredoxin
MHGDLFTIVLSFIEGFALIISPCILPILPIFLAASLTGSKRRPLGIIAGFILAFSLFTFFSRKLVQVSGIDLNLVRHLSFIILLMMGVIMLSSYLTEKFSLATNRLMNTGSNLSIANNSQGGFFSGLLFGSLIALIWTPCAGPILAVVIVQSVIQETNAMSFFTLLFFAMGAALPMLAIALFGRQMMTKATALKTHASLFRKLLGLIVILSVFYMVYQERVGTSNAVVETTVTSSKNLQKGLAVPYSAPAINGINAWINSPPLLIENLKGKVILIDFWTYSCINCLRTLPYLNAWYEKFRDQGLVIIGVHSPEFDFEKNLDNVKNAVNKLNIQYPVALDNQFTTWRQYANQYWPAHYLIDKEGKVVYTHFGEGEYDVTENNIRFLLGIKEGGMVESAAVVSSSANRTPETYLGYARAANFASPEAVTKDESARYTFPSNLNLNAWALQGDWQMMSDRIVATKNDAALEINFRGSKVYMVMGNAGPNDVKVTLMLDGKPLGGQQGKDVVNSEIIVKQHTLYEVISLGAPGEHRLRIVTSAPGLEVYTFTFS